jgi:hypothetical protein
VAWRSSGSCIAGLDLICRGSVCVRVRVFGVVVLAVLVPVCLEQGRTGQAVDTKLPASCAPSEDVQRNEELHTTSD